MPVGMLRSGRLLPTLMSDFGPASTSVALLELVRRDDVALLAVGVVQQRDAARAVGVVLDVRDLGRDAVLVVASEVDQPVGALVPTALVPGGDPAVRVAAALAVQRADERLLRRRPSDLGEVGDAASAAARRRRLVLTDAHACLLTPLSSPGRRTRRSPGSPARRVTIARLVSFRLPNPVRGTLALPGAVQGVHAEHLDAEHLLDGDLDLGLVRVRPDDEGVLALLDEPVALLRDHRREQDVARVGNHCASSSISSACASTAAAARCDGGSANPAASAASAVANHTSATVRA